jgi:hypothetical protein
MSEEVKEEEVIPIQPHSISQVVEAKIHNPLTHRHYTEEKPAPTEKQEPVSDSPTGL